ncbi:uncharacterized protein BDCG_07932 [Blastomyces dermatitidis ER-3]|uniref:Uncharacterized protein n=1 Tax=Ajellomyces dermatitidis (strain ER-3 / ATCC MYA-2586) TaxID=559297 RepID=A0ABP2EMQ6_AJEDR|nr:uncharacterized protein BDCG_07932 [Blastomyces dermatitidis ER-3]EEQ84663.2 hypothetical protein BDCG_07932 [Blastomyces dermatitidis ER-3]
MANAVTLAAFLQNGPPHVRINAPPNPGPNTTNTDYSWEDIHSLNAWPEFTLQHITNRYHQLLDTTSLPSEPITSPGPILGNQPQGPQGLTRVSYNEGEDTRILDSYKPDAAFFDEIMPATTSWNRAPVPVRRRDDDDNLDLAQPIPWNARGSPGNEQLTVMLVLWYLGMLAAQNNGPGSWNI